MTVTALNIASPQPAGQTGVGGGANASDAGPLAGFEALLSALFPQVDPTGATAMSAANANPLSVEGEPDGDATSDDAEAATDAAAPTAGDAAVALAASLMMAQPAATPAPVATGKAPDTPPAFGKDKTKGVPAFPALQAANPRAGLTEKTELATEAVEAGVDAAAGAEATAEPMTPLLGDETATRAQAAPQQQARNPAAPATPALAPVAQPEPPPTAAVDTPVEPPAAAAESAVEASAQTDVLPRTEGLPAPAPAAATNRTAKSERAKATDDASTASDEAPPLNAADKPLAAKAATSAATRPTDIVEERDLAPKDAKATVDEADASDTLIQGETRTAAQAATPTAHAASSARGGAETVANLAAQVVKKLGEKTTRFDVQLDPHGLGKVDVRIEIGAHGRITAGMTFENPQAAADVKARASELQKALEQAGFDLSGGISFDVAQDQGQRQQQNSAWQDQGDAGRAFQGRAFRAALETAGDAADAANQGALRLRRGVNSGVDVRI